MTARQRMAKAKEWVAKNFSESWWKDYEKQIAMRAYIAGTYFKEE